MRRENHPLGVRREVATKIATEEAEEAASSNKRWTFGAAAGALLVAGTFAAGALGISGGATPVAGSAPEHAPASPGHSPVNGSPVVGAPAPDKDDTKQKPRDPRAEQTSPASAGGPATGTQAVPGTGVEQGGSGSGGQGSGGAVAGGTSAETPAPAPRQPAPPQQSPAPAPAPAPAPEQPQGGLGQVLTPVTDTVGDVLTPVTDLVGGVLSPLSGGGSSATTQSAPAPSGPALTMINPLGDLLGG
ncbi:hypothetical protein [Actinophytocola glycyrrhizae]|uniref:Uncharacterized protein n=1 Tax=Actinophytocola glycyrrhizae TaxID=2044873 RepID=A0ABV9RWX9_9PSEU